jgi:hypothetical protein
MDRAGMALGGWRSVKQEGVYIKGYGTVPQLRAGLPSCLGFSGGFVYDCPD